MSVDLPESFDLYYYFRDGSGAITQLVKTRAATSTGVTAAFEIAAQYTYDPYGDLEAIIDTNGSGLCYINPLRYKDYIYDTDTGWYYLQSRYYDPQIGRFINADSFVSTGQGIMDTNMFMYCNNNPIAFLDSNGNRYISSMTIDDESWIDQNTSFAYANNRFRDLTDKLNDELEINASSLIYTYVNCGKFIATLDFVNNVKPSGKWDYKSREDWNLSAKYLYYYNDNILRYDDIGNLNYGYVGRILFGKQMLLRAGGVVQIAAGTSKWSYRKTNFDDPRDQEMIALGYGLWDMGDLN